MLALSTLQAGIVSPYDADIYHATGADPQRVALTKAIIAAESAWNPGALRAEPQINDASYGLMQVLLRTARLYRPDITPGELFIPAVNIEVGVAHLSMLLDRYDLADAVAAYNAGTPRRNEWGEYVNSRGATGVNAYVSNVLQGYAFYQEHQQAVEYPPDEVVPEGEFFTTLLSGSGSLPAWLPLALLGGAALLLVGRD